MSPDLRIKIFSLCASVLEVRSALAKEHLEQADIESFEDPAVRQLLRFISDGESS